MIAAVLIRGLVGVNKEVKATLKMLNLTRKNMCVILEEKPNTKGMLIKVKDYITWGNVSEETIKKLDTRKKKNQKSIRLNPPRKGFGRKGIKVTFKQGGTLGPRGDNINDLLNRML